MQHESAFFSDLFKR